MRLRPSFRVRWSLLGAGGLVPVVLAACLPGGRLPEMPVRKGGAMRALERGGNQAAGPFRPVFVGPEGEDVADPQIQIMFNKPLRALGQNDEPKLEAHFVPALAGRWEWLGTSAVRFVPSERLKDATYYTLDVVKKPTSLAGEPMSGQIKLAFSTPRPKLTSTDPAPNEENWSTSAPLLVELSQDVSEERLRAGLSLVKSDGTIVPTRFERREKDTHREDRGLLVPLAPLAEGERYELRLAAGVVGSEGPLPSKEQRIPFTTTPPLSVDELDCWEHDDGRCRSQSNVNIRLTDEMRPSDLRALLTVRPAVKLEPPGKEDQPSQYHSIAGAFLPNVTYTIDVTSSTKEPRQEVAKNGARATPPLRPLLRGKKVSLRWAPPEPGVHFSFGGTYLAPTNDELAARAEETKVAIAGAVPLDRDMVMAREIAASNKTASGDGNANTNTSANEPATPWWKLPGAKTITLPVRPTRQDPPGWATLKDVTPASGPLLFGARWDGFDGKIQQTTQPLQRTDLMLHARVSPEGTLVWITSLASGAPLDGVMVEARDVRGGKVRGATDKDGVALLATGTLTVERDKKRDRWQRTEKGFLVLFAQKGEDWMYERVSVPRPADLEGSVFTDRGLYRPGETTQLKGMIHRPTSRGLEPMTSTEVEVEIKDPNERSQRSTVRTNEWGTFHLPVPTALDAPLGYYQVLLHVGDQSVARGSFRVQEYRPATMAVSTRLDKAVYTRGDRVSCDAEARYLYGGTASGAQAQVWLHRESTHFAVPGLVGFSIADQASGEGPGGVAQAERYGKLDARGRHRETVTLTNLDQRGPELVMCDVTVTDAAQDRIAAGSSALVHPGEVYVALQPDRLGQVSPGQKLLPKVLVVTPAGEKRKRPVHLELLRAKIHPTVGWDTLPPETVSSCDVGSGDEPVSCALSVPNEPVDDVRRFVVRATTTEPQGTIGASFYLAPAKKTRRPPPPPLPPQKKRTKERPEPPVQTLVADKESYERDDVAHLTASSPFSRGHMLFTVEREGVLSHAVAPITREPVRLDVPIDARTAPFVNAVVTSVAPASDAKEHAHLHGHRSVASVKIEAGHDDHKLALTVRPSKTMAAPGEELDIDVDVRDVAGKPVRAEVTLYAADEGTLQLARYRLPAPLDGFYTGREATMQVEDARDKLGWLFDWQGELRDWARGIRRGNGHGRLGGSHRTKPPQIRMGATSVSSPRRNFDQGAFFLPSLVTDEAGHLRAHVKLPESLTAYRVMGFATTKNADVGAAETTVTTSMPLQARPTLPRVIRAGDRFVVGVMASNNGTSDLPATVSFAAEGLELSGASTQKVALPPGASERVLFDVAAKAPGKGKITVSVAGGAGLSDSAELPFEIATPVAMETAASYGVADGRVDERLADLATVRSDAGSLEVTLSSSPLAGLGAGLEQLVQYPHGCTEQTTSRLVPLLHLRPLASALEVKLPDDVPEALADGVRRVLANQREDGGFGLWPTSKETAPWLSVYATWGLSEAARLGVTVDPKGLAHARRYLVEALLGGSDDPAKRVSAPYALDVLAGALDPGQEKRGDDAAHGGQTIDASGLREIARQQLATRAGLPVFARAQLLHATGLLGLEGPERDALIAELTSVVHLDGPVARAVPQGDLLTEHFDSSARTSALILRALLATQPTHPLITPLALGLVQDRNGGTWRSTQETAWALLALDAYRQKAAPASAATTGEVLLGERSIFRHGFVAAPGAIAPDARTTIPMATVVASHGAAEQSMSFLGRGAPVYYQARLRFAPALLPREELSAGFEIHRSYRIVPSGLSHSAIRERRLREDDTGIFPEGTIVLVELSVSTTSPRRWLVLEDALPGGFESIDPENEGGEGLLRGLARGDHTRVERRDDRTVFFTDELKPGVARFSYLVRATIQGRFTAPPARVEEMYTPETFGRTGARDIVVSARAPEAAASP